MPPLARYAMAAASEVVHDRVALTAAIILGTVFMMAIFASQIAPWDPADKDVLRRLKPPFWEEGGSLQNLLGTDHLGRDVLSRLIHGARVSLLVGFAVVLFAGTVGTITGMLAGYYGGRVDDAIMRVVDVQTAFPGLLLALVILTMVSPSLESVIIVLGINGWMVYARMARGQVLSLREQQFFEAAVAVGCKARRIIFGHVLPNLASPVLTLAALEMARIILAEAILSFLGMGVQPPATSWGLMIAEGQDYLTNAWWLVTLPGLTIGITVLAVNLVASWLRTNADPAQRFRQGASDV
jgi:peptide/nickel transport system permease protein